MPLALEPNQTFKVVLESDKSKPKEEQPYFEFRFLSGRKWKELTRKKIGKSKDGADALDKLFELLKSGLTGWGNMIDPDTGKSIDFDLKNLDRLLTMSEAGELLIKFQNQAVESNDLKNSDSPSA
ncbi:MAG TPA: hypothetical protein ENH34_01405 [Phycisphaerales bacterium]|nr:hypothetical protein [Phycisphaerales bacterium]